MEYLRRFLIELRSRENEAEAEGKKKISIIMLIATAGGLLLGFLMDLLLPHGYFTNMIRGVVAILTGFTLFSSSYLFMVKRTDKKIFFDSYYKPVRERLSYKQRINSSIALGVVVASFVLLSSSSGLVFTTKATIATFVIISLVAFSRRSRSEFIKDIYEIPDIRDLESERERKKMADARKEKSNKKENKKEKTKK